MASVTDIAKPSRSTVRARTRRAARRGGGLLIGSRLGRLIVALNLLGLAVLIGGALVLSDLRKGLINAQIDSLTTQGEFIANVVERAATTGEPAPRLDQPRAIETLQLLFIPRSQRARIFDVHGNLVADSYVIGDRVEWRQLPPAHRPGELHVSWPWSTAAIKPQAAQAARDQLKAEVAKALSGSPVARVRRAQNGERVVSVSLPIQHVQAVLGVLTLEVGDVDEIVAAERRALIPFILVAIAVTLLSSILLNRLVALPVRQLARAADSVRLSRARSISLPALARRNDELGDLTRSLESMTDALSQRMDAIERFAADVAHEIRNPLTSIRSAVETLDLVGDGAGRERLMGILKQDVSRLDRLITDISNASRLDAELSRETPKLLDLGRLLADIARLYEVSASPGEPPVRFEEPDELGPFPVSGREGPLSQVFRNLVDNARSFTRLADRPQSAVRLSVRHVGREILASVEDDGPGLPPDNLETVFERFYTSRPKGAAFGGNSGLGLSIARQIVEAHGGRIWAENRIGKNGAVVGARFTVSLPEHAA